MSAVRPEPAVRSAALLTRSRHGVSEAPSPVIRTSIASQGGGYAPECLTPASPHVRQQNPLHHGTGAALAGASCRRTDGTGERPQSASEAGLCRRVRAMADGPQLRQIHLASSRQQGPGLGPLAGEGSAAGVADGDLMSFLPNAAQHFLSYSPAHLPSDMEGTRLTRCADVEPEILFAARRCLAVIPATNRDAVHANVGAAQFVDMRRGGHVACPLQNRCRVIACCG